MNKKKYNTYLFFVIILGILIESSYTLYTIIIEETSFLWISIWFLWSFFIAMLISFISYLPLFKLSSYISKKHLKIPLVFLLVLIWSFIFNRYFYPYTLLNYSIFIVVNILIYLLLVTLFKNSYYTFDKEWNLIEWKGKWNLI